MVKKKNPLVFLDVSIDGDSFEKMVFELFSDIVPKTAENFRALCTGEKGIGPKTGKPLHYEGSFLHRIFKGSMAQGDFSNLDATGRRLTAGCHPCHRHFSSASSASTWLSAPGNPLVNWPHQPQQNHSPSSPNPNPTPQKPDFSTLCNLLRDPTLRPGPPLESALDQTLVEPDPALLLAVFESFDCSPRLIHGMFLWAEKKPGFRSSAVLLNLIVNVLGKAREFDFAWSLIRDRVGKDVGACLVSADTFAILIRRYCRAGMCRPAIRTFDYASNLDLIRNSGGGTVLFEILLDSLCKEGHVKVAAEYLDEKREADPCWVPSVRVYNILLNGWFRVRKLKHAERLWLQMRKENVVPTVVTYGTLVEGYCRMRRVEIALDLVDEMRREGIEPNTIVYNPIIDALAEVGRFKEVSRMMERFMLCESGPTISTYNSLVKGYCKAKDLVGASKILKMMISRGIIPSPTTYNYFFRHFSKFGKVEEGMNLYTKMIESGYRPDRLTYHLLLKMLCEEERLDLAVQVSREMRARGCDMDLATSTMLIHLLCKMHRFNEAFAEFEDMIRRGIVPQYLTFRRLNDELSKHGMTEMAQKLCEMISSVPHSTELPNTYNVDGEASRRAKRRSVLQKAEAISEMLKTCNNPRKLVKLRSFSKRSQKKVNKT